MATNAKEFQPDASAMQLHRFFTDNWYAVPPYQRDYTWGIGEVRALLQDILDFESSADPYYMIGQVIVAPFIGGDEDFELVDGQQRCTTLFLMAIALYKKMPQVVEPGSTVETLKNRLFQMIKINEIDKTGWRVRVAAKGPEVVKALFEGSPLPEQTDVTSQNISNAYSEIEDWIETNLSDPDRLNGIVDLIQRKMWLTRLSVEGRRQAVIMYERINNRGKDLDGSDLIKNLLFASIGDDQYNDVSEMWNSASETLATRNKGGADPSGDEVTGQEPKSLPFRLRSIQYLLRAWLIAESGKKVQDADVYKEWENRLSLVDGSSKESQRLSVDEIEQRSLAFAQQLPNRAKQLRRIGTERSPISGAALDVLPGSRFFESIQQYPILLSGSHLSEEIYRELAMRVEVRILLGLLAKERNQDLESLIPKWAHRVSCLSSNAGIAELDDACSDAAQDVSKLLFRASENFLSFYYSSAAQRKKIRLILGRATLHVQSQLKPKDRYVLDEFLREPKIGGKRAPKKGWDLDHIFSQAGYPDHPLLDWVGNLVLTDVNQRGAGKKPPEEKVDEIYASSGLALTRSLCPIDRLGGLSKPESNWYREIEKSYVASAADWNSVGICERVRLYWNLFSESLNADWSAVPVLELSPDSVALYLEQIFPGLVGTEEFVGSRYFRKVEESE